MYKVFKTIVNIFIQVCNIITFLKITPIIISGIFIVFSIKVIPNIMKGNVSPEKFLKWGGVLIITIILNRILLHYCKKNQCPSCKKLFCLQGLGQEEVGRKSISVLVETKIKNEYREISGYQEQYVPGERIIYQVNWVCKKCGEPCYLRYSQDYASI